MIHKYKEFLSDPEKMNQLNFENIIRVSCASFSRIMIDDKYLLILNKASLKKGNKVYTPIGGALEYTMAGKKLLDKLNPTWERNNKDLRLFFSEDKISEFTKWFKSRQDREIDPFRELQEELVDEEHILESLNRSDIDLMKFNHIYIELVPSKEAHKGFLTQYYFEIFDVKLNVFKESEIKDQLPSTNIIKLVTDREILNGMTKTGEKIGTNSKSLIKK